MAIMLHNVTAYRENNSVAGQLVEQVLVGDLQCAPVEGAEPECGRYGKAVLVLLERSIAGLPRGPWVLKAAAPEDPADVEAARECLVWEREALAGQNRTPFLPGLAASGVLADEAETPFLLMSPVEGRTLREALEGDPASLAPEPPEGGPLAEEARKALAAMRGKRRLPVVTAVREVALPLAEGLARLEERGFCHGDVSPSNVVVGEDGSVRMVDLGCLGSLGERPRGKGTAPYVLPGWDKAPGGRPGNCRGVDAYALAVLLREMTGPTEDLVPPAVECARALEKAGLNSSFGWQRKSRCFALGREDERTVSQAYYAIAVAMERWFSEALDACISSFKIEDEGDGESDAGVRAETTVDTNGLCRVFKRYDNCWSGGIWTLLEMLAGAMPLSALIQPANMRDDISGAVTRVDYVMSLEGREKPMGELLDESLAFAQDKSVFLANALPAGIPKLACPNTVSGAILECIKTDRITWACGNYWGLNGVVPDESSMLIEQAAALGYESDSLEEALALAWMAGRCAKRERNRAAQASVAIKLAELQYLRYCFFGGEGMLRKAAGLALNALRTSACQLEEERAVAHAVCVLSEFYKACVDDNACRLMAEKALDLSSMIDDKSLEAFSRCLLLALTKDSPSQS